MTTLTAKQREIRGRERRILNVATAMVRDGGSMAIRMDAIAKQLGVTRGTIYNHFPHREDIVLSLADRAIRRRIELFQFAASLSVGSRDQIATVGLACEVYVDEMPDDFAVEQMIRHDNVWQKCSEARRENLRQCEANCMSSLSHIIDRAIRQGDLSLPRRQSPVDVLFGLWSLTYGGMMIELSSPSLAELGIRDSRETIRRNCNAMLDGLDWRPRYDAEAYRRLVRRVRRKLVAKAGQIVASEADDSHSLDSGANPSFSSAEPN